MDEKIIVKLIKDISANSMDFEFVRNKQSQCHQAIEWAKQLEKWDLIIKIVDVCVYYPDQINAFTQHLKTQDKIITSDQANDFYNQSKLFALEGLTAAKHIKDQAGEQEFLMVLSQLSASLADFEMALNYLKQELTLVPLKSRWVVGQTALNFGRQAQAERDYLAARAFYQLSLDTINETEEKSKANVLDWMASNEMDAGNLSLAQELMDKIEKIRNTK